jgi:spore coat polysaccharide biosynthesis protein SpsF (cytidylyltransferase family)/aryl-alcohol dehydrogenase-like predicted oxidoreductase
MTVRILMQSRLSSSRLPAKALLTVAGQPLVVLAARRASNTGRAVVVATSTEPEDDAIVTVVESAGLSVFRGSLDDPLARFAAATVDLAPDDIVVRLTGDNVLPDGHFVEWLESAVSSGQQYVRAGGDKFGEVPYGVSGEAFTVAALRHAHEHATDSFDREHVTPMIRREFGDRVLTYAESNAAWRGLRCTIDTFDDFVRVQNLFANVPDAVSESWQSLADRLAASEAATPTSRSNSMSLVKRKFGAAQSRIILGTAQLGMPYGAANMAGQPSAHEARDILDAAVRLGITHADTARAYGDSEGRIGAALSRGLSESLDVVTKLRPMDDLPNDAPPELGFFSARASLLESLIHLQSASVDTVLTHRAQDWFRPGVKHALLEAQHAGLARAIGVSLESPHNLERVLADPDVNYIQIAFNLLDRRLLSHEIQGLLSQRRDVVVVTRSVFLQGLLASDAEVRWPSNADQSRDEMIRAVDAAVTKLGRRNRADLALAFALSQTWISSVVVGADSAAQLKEVVDLSASERLTSDDIDLLLETVPEGTDVLVNPSMWEFQ